MSTRDVNRSVSRRFGMQGYLGGLTIALMLLVGLLLAAIGYAAVNDFTKSAMRNVIKGVADSVENEIIYSFRYPARAITQTLSRSAVMESRSLRERMASVPALAAVFEDNPNIGGIYMAFNNGDFFSFRRIAMEAERRGFGAPAGAVYRVRYIVRDESSQETGIIYYDGTMAEIDRRIPEPSEAFDPLARYWYLAAMEAEGLVESHPYILSASSLPVVTFSRKADNGRVVVAVDILMERFSAVLNRLLPTPNSHLILFQPDGDILGSSHVATVGDGNRGFLIRSRDDFQPISRLAMEAYQAGRRGGDINMHDGRQAWNVTIEEFRYVGNFKDAMILAIPEADLLADGRKFLFFTFVGVLGLLLLALPLMWLAMHRIVAPLHRLTEKAGRLVEFDADDALDMESNVAEVHELAKNISGQREQVKKILDIFRLIGSERDMQFILNRVVRDVLTLSGADGGGLALSDEKGDFLDQATYYWKGAEVQLVPFSPPEKRAPDLVFAFQKAMARESAYQYSIPRESQHARELALAPGFINPEVVRVDEVCIALRDRTGNILGILALCKSAKADDPIFPPSQVAFIESLAAAVAIVLETQQLIRSQRDLRDGFLTILAGAIDAKSPFTGSHCERVPIIFQMLLRAACEAREGPLAGFSMSEDEWEEARLAAWLHDCGKVTTPEYVVDKATKLETICDRIHEIRTRFEVLKRDAELDSLKAVLAGADAEKEREKCKAALDVLDGEFAFIASCNIGDKEMSEGDLAHLAVIGRRSWTRTLDKRLGISRNERARIDAAGGVETPTREYLLMDNPEHVIARGEKDSLPLDNPWGFKGKVPELLYNRGELYNLRISQGTLTEEERYKINDHIRQTIIMLESMSWPKQLSNMAKIAGEHHETMDGRGYPRGLRDEDMSLPARMMAIADIFEALTAWNRPYKASKTLREALEIMDGFKQRNHIDPVLYDLFVESGIPQNFAEQYLKPEQNDL